MRTLAVALWLVLLGGPVCAQTPGAPVDARYLLRALEEAFASVADRVTPAVVNVSTSGRRAAPGLLPESDPESEESGRDPRRRPREDRGSGSGVIVDPNGYVLTNDHVIENASDITVRLFDQRKFAARLVGRDPKTDLAVLKIDAPAPLPVAELGDSDRLRVGQWAIAIGSPFGLDRSVTVGIVSATGRNRVGVATYEKFIQTDASINPGNSGGPLCDIDGRVIGVNTAIVAAGQGIGFSIPINMAKDVLRQLIDRGRVVRGWLGVVIQDVTDELSESFGVSDGVLVADVMPGGPGDAGGLRPGDVIVRFGGAPVTEVPELQGRVAAVTPGQRVAVTVMRDRAPVELGVTIGEMPSETASSGERNEQAWGLTVEALAPDAAQRFRVAPADSVIVVDVAAGSPAARAGLRRGDVIVEVARQRVADLDDLARALAAIAPGESVPLRVLRLETGGQAEYLALERPARP